MLLVKADCATGNIILPKAVPKHTVFTDMIQQVKTLARTLIIN